MRFPSHLGKDFLSRQGYVGGRMEVRSLKGIKRLLWSDSEDHVPTTALQSSSVRSNLYICESQRLNG